MEAGNVAAILFAKAKVKSRAEWESAVAGIWDDTVAEVRSNPGFIGILTLWNSDDSGQVSVIGVWESMEHRLAYEARSAEYVRGLFNPLFEAVPDRPRYIISSASLA